jgi:hypothetical protein
MIASGMWPDVPRKDEVPPVSVFASRLASNSGLLMSVALAGIAAVARDVLGTLQTAPLSALPIGMAQELNEIWSPFELAALIEASALPNKDVIRAQQVLSLLNRLGQVSCCFRKSDLVPIDQIRLRAVEVRPIGQAGRQVQAAVETSLALIEWMRVPILVEVLSGGEDCVFIGGKVYNRLSRPVDENDLIRVATPEACAAYYSQYPGVFQSFQVVSIPQNGGNPAQPKQVPTPTGAPPPVPDRRLKPLPAFNVGPIDIPSINPIQVGPGDIEPIDLISFAPSGVAQGQMLQQYLGQLGLTSANPNPFGSSQLPVIELSQPSLLAPLPPAVKAGLRNNTPAVPPNVKGPARTVQVQQVLATNPLFQAQASRNNGAVGVAPFDDVIEELDALLAELAN